MQSQSETRGLRVFWEEMGSETRPATIKYSHNARKKPARRGEVYIRSLRERRFECSPGGRGSYGWIRGRGWIGRHDGNIPFISMQLTEAVLYVPPLDYDTVHRGA